MHRKRDSHHPLSQAPAGSQPRAAKTKLYDDHAKPAVWHATTSVYYPAIYGTRGGAGLGVLNARKTATAPVLMPGA